VPISFVEKFGRRPIAWFDSEDERIVSHLEYVIRRLSECGKIGSETIEDLKAYARKRTFPRNVSESICSRTPIFVDRFDTPCAVAHLMRASGAEGAALARFIDQRHHTSLISDILLDADVAGRVSKWASTRGLTSRDLAMIQPGYTPIAQFQFGAMIVCASIFMASFVNYALLLLLSVFYYGDDGRLWVHILGALPLIFVFPAATGMCPLPPPVTERLHLIGIGLGALSAFPAALYIYTDPFSKTSGGWWIQEWCFLVPWIALALAGLWNLKMSRDPENFKPFRRYRRKEPRSARASRAEGAPLKGQPGER